MATPGGTERRILYAGGPTKMNAARRFMIAACALLALSAQAQSFPSKPVTLVVPFTAGGPTDTIARIFAERLSRSLGQPVIVENVTGAGGTLGVGKVVRAAPDG